MTTDYSSAEVAQMKHIHERWGQEITAVAHTSTVTEPFLAALIAGESNGDPTAARFEPAVFEHLMEVCIGKRAAFSVAGIHRPLGAQDILGFIGTNPASFVQGLHNAAELATSYGLTQIMGWHMVELYQEDKMAKLISDPGAQLTFTLQLLVVFANKYDLDLAKETEALFTCWNTGEPDGHTYDPHYVANGQRRIEIYQQISQMPPATGGTIQ